MPLVSFAQLFGLSGVTLGVVATWYQFQRARRVSVDGISLATWFQFMLMAAFWISYGFAVHSKMVVAGSVFVLPMQAAIVARLEPWRHWTVLVRSVVFIGGCCLVPTVLLGWSAGAIGTGVAMVLNRLPQIIELIRHRGDLGVSALSWAVGALCSVMWMSYYLGDHMSAPLIATGFGLVGNLVIASLAAWRHRQAQHDLRAADDSVGPLAGGPEQRSDSLQMQTQ